MIEFIDVSKVYEDNHKILSEVNLRINEGDFVVIKGDSGSGKTTLLNLLSFIDTEFEGSIIFENKKVDNAYQSSLIRRNKIGYIFQDFKLINEYTIRQNLEIILNLMNLHNSHSQIETIFSKLNLSTSYLDKYPSQVSGGEKQRIALARALIKNPKVIIGDEVTGSLDRKNAIKIVNLLKQLNQQGITIIVSTHDEALFNIGNRLFTVEGEKVYEDQ